MIEADDGYSPDLAHWLEESGRRRAIRLEESPEELLKYVEELAGQRLRTRDDVLLFFKAHEAEAAERERARENRRIVRESCFLGLLLLAVGQYYYWDVSLQVAALERNYYFISAPASQPRAEQLLLAA